MSAKQPISTAPRNGTVIQLCAEVDGKEVLCLNGHWDGENWQVTTGGYWSEGDDCGPTHWRPTR